MKVKSIILPIILFTIIIALMVLSIPYLEINEDKASKPIVTQEIQSTLIADNTISDWKDVPLMDQYGNTVSINQINHNYIVVELMAMYCPQCVAQQREMSKLVGNDDITMVSIDIAPNEDYSQLSYYVESNRYSWPFVIDKDQKITSELIKKYGIYAINPQATPIIIINKHGNEFLLPNGIKDAEFIKEQIEKNKFVY